MAEHVFFFGDLPPDSVSIAGGKGASLSRMAVAGLPVPPGFVVSADGFHTFLDRAGLADRIASLTSALDVENADDVDQASSAIRRLILETPLPAELTSSVRRAHAALPSAADLVAVRSSAVCEDGSTASFAGQQETYLNVRGSDDVLRRIQDCWASFFSPRALFYRGQKAVLGDTRMAVVVQEMVAADKSGVLFTVDPIRGRAGCMVIEAAHGLGESIVSGEVIPDHYVLSRSDGSLVDEFLADTGQRVLGENELSRLASLGLQLEEFFGSPQDVEWSIRGGDVFLLQSRPITTLGQHV